MVVVIKVNLDKEPPGSFLHKTHPGWAHLADLRHPTSLTGTYHFLPALVWCILGSMPSTREDRYTVTTFDAMAFVSWFFQESRMILSIRRPNSGDIFALQQRMLGVSWFRSVTVVVAFCCLYYSQYLPFTGPGVPMFSINWEAGYGRHWDRVITSPLFKMASFLHTICGHNSVYTPATSGVLQFLARIIIDVFDFNATSPFEQSQIVWCRWPTFCQICWYGKRKTFVIATEGHGIAPPILRWYWPKHPHCCQD